MRRVHVAATLAALAVAGVLAFAILPREDDTTSSSSRSGETRQPELLEGSGPSLETQATHDPAPDKPVVQGDWIVRGRVLIGAKEPAPNRKVTVKGFEGYEAEGTPTLQAELVSDAQGYFAWPLQRPTRPMLLQFSVKDGPWDDEALALPDAPAPESITLHIYERDAKVVGRVTDMDGKPIEGAELVRYQQAPIPCAEDGSFEISVHSQGNEARVTARAPGYAMRRASVGLAGPGSVGRVHIKLPGEFRITGKVTDPDGRPLEGAVVKTFMTSFNNKAVTNARGEYVLGNLDPGRPKHSLFARHKEFTEAKSRVDTLGDSVEVNLQLGRGARVSGRVTNEAGVPLEGASLYIGFSPSAYNRLDTMAKDGGLFVFEVVEPGSQTLVASRPGYASTRLVLELKTGLVELPDVEVVLTRGRSVSGRVVDAGGQPMPNVHVSWTQGGEYITGRVMASKDGSFEARHLPFGSLGAEVYGSTIQRMSQEIPDGQTAIDDLVLTVKASAKLAGRVLDSVTGKPVTNFLVRFVRAVPRKGEERAWGYSATWSREGHRFSETDGYWDTEGEQLTTGGVYGIEISAAGYAPATNGRVIAKVAPPRDDTMFELIPGALLTGTIVDAITKRPVGDAVVKLFDEDNPLSESDMDDVHGRKLARTDAKGNFRIADLAPGSVQLYVVHPAYAPARHGPLVMDAGVEARAGQLELGKGGSVEGTAGDDDGNPMPGVRVEVRIPGQRGKTWDTTADDQGRFRLDQLPAGPVSVQRMRQSPQGHYLMAYTVRTQVEHGRTTTVWLGPNGSATIRGALRFEGEVPKDAVVWLVPVGEPKRENRLGRFKDGAFSFARVEPGAYRVQCTFLYTVAGTKQRKGWSGSAEFELVEDELKDLELGPAK